jgi:uncharacterized membrane protein
MNLMMVKREKVSKFLSLLFVLFFLFVLLQLIAPVLFPTGSYSDLSGSVAIQDNEQETSSMPFPFNLVYSCGDRLCHQKADRSFFINGNQMAFCSRCTAIWMGLVFGLGLLLFYKIPLDGKFFALLFISFIPIGIDGVGQLINLWESTTLSRLFTGLFVGITTGMAIGVIVDELKETPLFDEERVQKYKKLIFRR